MGAVDPRMADGPANLQRGREDHAPAPCLEAFTGSERILLLANGNLQSIVSAFHNAPVSVRTVTNRRVAEGRYERLVELIVRGHVFAEARSTVVLDSRELSDALEKEGLSLGPLLSKFHILPSFTLQSAERLEGGGFSREYTLEGRGVLCAIAETFWMNPLDMPPDGEGDDGAEKARPLAVMPCPRCGAMSSAAAASPAMAGRGAMEVASFLRRGLLGPGLCLLAIMGTLGVVWRPSNVLRQLFPP